MPNEICKVLTAVIVEKVIMVREEVWRSRQKPRFSLPLNRFFIFTKIKQTGRDPIAPMIVDGIPWVCGIK
jgi:hypothetical protein